VRILAYEFITGGGMAREPLPAGLRAEGDLMLRALARDLAELPWLDVTVTRDARMPPLRVDGVRVLPVEPGSDPLAAYLQAMDRTDAVWPVAPETGGTLEALARAACRRGRLLVGCRPEAIAVAASKLRTAAALRAAGIPVVPTFGSPDRIGEHAGRWVVKPDDGAGCAGTCLVDGAAVARAMLSASPRGARVAQPWIEGEALSLSVVVGRRRADVLCCNRQHVEATEGRLSLRRLDVNALPPTPDMVALAQAVARAIPGLEGYVGIDLVAGPGGLTVIEINPRLTTSFAGLRRALGCNLAALVLAQPSRVADLAPDRRRAVSIGLAAAHG
jgi:predicted ATP-grasp superfamily ATP-dependent carboligase